MELVNCFMFRCIRNDLVQEKRLILRSTKAEIRGAVVYVAQQGFGGELEIFSATQGVLE
jgi:PII-like signaling protein